MAIRLPRRGIARLTASSGGSADLDEIDRAIADQGTGDGPSLPRMGVTGGGMLNHQGGMIDLPMVEPGGAGMAIASADPNFVPTIAGTGETATPQKAEIKYSIWDRTTKDITPRAAKLLDSMASAGPQFGVTRIEFKAGKGPGHLSHAGGDQFDIIGYQADGTKWTPEQRVAMASAARDKGATRFGFYPWTEPDAKDRTLVSYAHAGQGVLHVGLSGRGLPSAVWGAGGLTSGDASRRFTNSAEKAFTKSFDAGKPFDASSYVQYAATGGVKSGAPPADIPQSATDPIATAADPALTNPRLPVSMAADAERQAAAEAVAAASPGRSTLTRDDMNAERPTKYSQGDLDALKAYADVPWTGLPAGAQKAITKQFGDRAPQVYETMRSGLPGGPPRIQPAPVQEASLATPLARPAAAAVKGSDTDARALADMAYREARGEGDDGMRAVMHVGVNRASAGPWKGTPISAIVTSGEFAKGSVNRASPQWKSAYANAQKILAGQDPDNTNGSLYFANVKTADPRALRQITRAAQKVGSIGNHTFYKPGGGALPATPVSGGARAAVVPSVAAKPPAPPAASSSFGLPAEGHPPTLQIGAGKAGSPDPWTGFLQQKLKDAYPNAFKDLAVDGVFGPQTRNAVRAFSLSTNDPKPNGRAGPHVWGTLAKIAPEPGFGPFPRLRPDVAEPSAAAAQPDAAALALSKARSPTSLATKGDLAPVPVGVLGYPAAQPLTPRIQPIDAPPTRAFTGDEPAAAPPPPRQIETRVVPVPAASGAPPVPPKEAVRMGAGAGPAGAAFSTPPRLSNPDSPEGTGVAGLLNLDRLMGNMRQMPNSPPAPDSGWPNPVTDYPGFVKKAMEVAMPNEASVPPAARAATLDDPAMAEAQRKAGLYANRVAMGAPPEGDVGWPGAGQPSPRIQPSPATGAAATDPGVLGRAGGILTMLRQMAAGGGLVDPANVGLPSPSLPGRPRLTPSAVSSGGARAPYAMQPAQPRIQAALRDMAFGSGAADAQPGAAFGTPQPGGKPAADTSSDAARAAAPPTPENRGSSSSSSTDVNNLYPPATADDAIRQLQAAIDAMNSVENSATMGAY